MSRANRILLVLLAGLGALGAFRLRIDTDIVNLLPANNSVSQGLKIYQEQFLQSGELLVTLQAASPEQAEEAVLAISRELSAASNLVRQVFWQPPARESLEDSARFLAYLWLNSPAENVTALERSISGDELSTTLAEARRRIQSSLSPADLVILPRDPLHLSGVAAADEGSLQSPEQFFSSPDGTFRILYVYAATELKDYAQCAVWLREIRRILNGVVTKEGKDLSIGLTGRPVFVNEIASGMRSDMSTAAPGTLLMIALLFFLVHREWRSLVLLLGALGLVMICTVAAGAALLGSLNVISIGFAAILLGLAEDFGVVLHQEVKSHPHAGLAEIRKDAGPAIWWSAITTASAFALLNLSSLPGLRQLGTLIAIGILLGAGVMLYLFLPLLKRYGRGPETHALAAKSRREARRFPRIAAILATLIFFTGAVAILLLRPPEFSSSPDVLRPRQSEASAALKRVQENIGAAVEPLWLFVRGTTVDEVRASLEKVNAHLTQNIERAGIESYTLPLSVWPQPKVQETNLLVLKKLAQHLPHIREAILAQGFTSDALQLTDAVFAEWNSYSTGQIQWPRGRVADWVLPKFVARTETNFLALGLITPNEKFDTDDVVPEGLKQSVLLSGWSLMGKQVVAQVKGETPKICAAVGLVVVVALWTTYKRFSGVLLSLAVLLFSGVVLVASMSLFGWQWNLINLTALPLLLGMGIDYSIHMQTALQRADGVWAGPAQGIARALALAGSTSIIGFAFLALSSNVGMASLGSVCALGLTILLLTSIFLLPAWIESGRNGTRQYRQ